MVDILLLSMQARFTVIANRIINFLSKIPLLKRVFETRLYGEYGVKTVIAMFGALLMALRKIFMRSFYIGFMILAGLILYVAAQKGGWQQLFAELTDDEVIFSAQLIGEEIARFSLTAWFYLSFIGGFLNSVSIGATGIDNDRVMVNYLRADARLYTQARIVLTIISDIALYLPCVLVAMYIGKIPMWCAVPMLLMYAAFRLLGEMINMLFFRLTKRHFGIPPYSFSFWIPVAAAAYFPVYTAGIDWAAVLSNPLTWLLSAAAGFGAWVYIDRYQLHAGMIRERIGRIGEMINKQKAKNNFGDMWGNQRDAAKWHKDIDASSLQSDKHTNKTGFAYLNAVFFDRHSKYFARKMFTRCAFSLAPVLLAAAFAAYSVLFGEGGIAFEGREIPFNFAPVFFFILYLASMGRVVTASVFSNCDVHMLNYAYYRTKETTAASFKSRFAVILRDNMIISAILAFSVLGAAWLLFGYMDYTYAWVFIALLLMIGLLFSFNDLFLYYVIQPYDSTGQSKSIAYTVINFVIYIIAYINLQIRLDLIDYTIFTAVMTALYIGIGTVLLATLAPKKFKLR